MSVHDDILIGRILADLGLVDQADVDQALASQREAGAEERTAPRLGEILVAQGRLAPAQLEQALGEQRRRLGATAIGPYRLEARIGEGAMGTVYRGVASATGAPVAIKFLAARAAADDEYIARFRREARIGMELHHPNLVETLDFGEDRGTHYLVMELIEGGSLEQRLAAHGPLAEADALRTARDVLAALRHVHEHGLVHRDVKPANILYDRSGRARLSDLGLAKIRDPKASFMTAVGITVGTPHYAAPEQILGEADVDIRADLYSLGATLHQAVTGSTPFTGKSAMAIINQHLNHQPPSPLAARPGLGAGCVAVIQALMAKDRDLRYPTPAAAGEDVERVLDGQPPHLALELLARRPRAMAPAIRGAAGRQARPSPRDHQQRSQGRRWLPVAGLALASILVLCWRPWRGAPVAAPAAPASALAAVPAPVAKAEPAVDLMAIIDPLRDQVSGGWSRRGGALVSDEASVSRLRIPLDLPEEYDFRIDFALEAGDDGIAQILSLHGHQFSWTMGGGGNTVFGLGDIAGRDAGGNPTTVRRPRCIEPGRSHAAVVEVRADGVRALLDGAELCRWRSDGSDLACRPDDGIGEAATLGLATWRSRYAITRAELVPIAARSGAPPATARSRVTDLMPLIEVPRDVVSGTWRKDADGLGSEPAGYARLRIGCRPPPEYDYLVEFTRVSRNDAMLQMMNLGGHPFSWTMGSYGDTVWGFCYIGGKGARDCPAAARTALTMENGRRYRSLVRVRKDGIAAVVDGRRVAAWRTDGHDLGVLGGLGLPGPEPLGLGSWNSGVVFHRVELVEVHGAEPPEQPR